MGNSVDESSLGMNHYLKNANAPLKVNSGCLKLELGFLRGWLNGNLKMGR
jgi:hypothetical protein